MAAINSVRASQQYCLGYTHTRTGVVTPALTWAATGGLSPSSQLESAALRHATDMAVNNFFGHTGSDATSVLDRAPAAGYVWQSIGENIAAGYVDVPSVVSGWLNSNLGHCEAIMNPAFVDIGVSCKYKPSSDYQYYWTLVMGKR
jgi:uncharacterized protein YkwD